MIRLVTRGRFTQDYAKALVAAPEDREPAVRKLIEGAGGKLLSFYFTTGDTDFMVISEANEAESIIAAMLAAEASGTISNLTTARAWTGAEFKAVAEKAGKAASFLPSPWQRLSVKDSRLRPVANGRVTFRRRPGPSASPAGHRRRGGRRPHR